jgi:hypothetical protein
MRDGFPAAHRHGLGGTMRRRLLSVSVDSLSSVADFQIVRIRLRWTKVFIPS